MSSKKNESKFLDNSGWDAKVGRIEDPEIFEDERKPILRTMCDCKSQEWCRSKKYSVEFG